jgi:catechol 2,3-dioxygenase-like lactoylglutathione lyase family enzyme
MSAPTLCGGIDHVHVYVPDRDAAAAWYAEHLGLTVAPDFACWADDPRGPLTLRDAADRIHLAVFARAELAPVSLAFAASAAEYLAWREYLCGKDLGLREADHTLSRSLYFADPWRNQWEITCYAVAALGRYPVIE